ncbi:MAG: hypothetical protein V3U73_00720 [bacterium]
MKRNYLILTALLLILSSNSNAQPNKSPYVGQQDREIRALTEEDIQGYLEGWGMGLAKAAELNHYPGPIHVIELSTELGLPDVQLEKTRAIFSEMQQEAKRLGQLIVVQEEGLDKLFNSLKMDPGKLQESIMHIADLNGKLRLTHLMAHLQMKSILSPEQILKYDVLRGYASSQTHHPMGHKPIKH